MNRRAVGRVRRCLVRQLAALVLLAICYVAGRGGRLHRTVTCCDVKLHAVTLDDKLPHAVT